MSESTVHTLASYVEGVSFDRLPPDVISKAEVCVLDVLGCAVVAADMPSATVAAAAARSLGSRGSATVWTTGERMRASDSVIANSVAAHCILQDDWLEQSHSHIGVAVVPTALALAEEHERGGREVIAAIVAAYEVEDRVGAFSVPTFTRGFRASSVFAPFGAVTAAARLIGLDRVAIANALGAAGGFTGGVLQPWLDGAMEWAFQEAMASRAAIASATMAAHGFNGSRAILEGPRGVYSCFAGTSDGLARVVEGLGEGHQILETCFKRFPTGGANQGSAAVAATLKERHGFDARDIVEVRVSIPLNGTHERMNYAGIPYQGPFVSVDQCLISKPFAIAMILLYGDMHIDTVRASYQDPSLESLCHRVVLTEDPSINGWDLRMEVELRDGTLHVGDGSDIDRSYIYLNFDDAARKFARMAGPRLGEERTQQVIDVVAELPQLDSMLPLMDALVQR